MDKKIFLNSIKIIDNEINKQEKLKENLIKKYIEENAKYNIGDKILADGNSCWQVGKTPKWTKVVIKNIYVEINDFFEKENGTIMYKCSKLKKDNTPSEINAFYGNGIPEHGIKILED